MKGDTHVEQQYELPTPQKENHVAPRTPLSLEELRELATQADARIAELERPQKELEALYIRRMEINKAIAYAARGGGK
jgi:hypothetical protein